VGSLAGVSDDKLLALDNYADSSLFTEAEQVALEYADAMTRSDEDVSDELFERLSAHFQEPAMIELTAVIAWENASSKFNRALRIGSQHLWKRS
jgi:alkylhydroperoxidase family enzyme